MKIHDVAQGTTVTISEGPAKGREVTVSSHNAAGNTWVMGDGSTQEVRGTLEVEPR